MLRIAVIADYPIGVRYIRWKFEKNTEKARHTTNTWHLNNGDVIQLCHEKDPDYYKGYKFDAYITLTKGYEEVEELIKQRCFL